MSSFRLVILAGILIAGLVLAAGCTQQPARTVPADAYGGTISATPTGTTTVVPQVSATLSSDAWKQVRLETNMGTITIALDPAMPITVSNFTKLVQKGYYNGVIFHRVMDGFMIQGGDPTGTGRGGPGYVIQDEFTTTNRNNRGTIAMANSGPNTGGSQFFINLVDNNYLDTKHPVFGKVVGGMDVVDRIGKVQTDANNRPLQNVTILRAEMV
jgi:peptidylprolyl isomerase